MLTARQRLLSTAVVAMLAIPLPRSLGQTGAGGKRPMTFADLQTMKRISDPQISPGGHWVLFSVTDVDLARNTKTNHLWVVPLPTQGTLAGTATAPAAGQERQLTSGDGEASGRFSPDEKQVAFVAGDQVQLASWNEADGTLGRPHALTAIATGADGPVWSPDSRRLLFVSPVYPVCSSLDTWHAEDTCDKEKDDAAAKSPVKAQLWDHLLYRHWDHFTGDKRSHIFVAPVASSPGDIGLGKGVRDLTPRSVVGDAETPTFSLGGPIGYAWAPDSHEIAYVTNLDTVPAASTNNDIFTLRLDEPDAKATKISKSSGSDDAPAYSPDGKYLAFRSQARAGYESDRFRLMLYDRNSRKQLEIELRRKTFSSSPRISVAGIEPASAKQMSRGESEHDLDTSIDEFIWSADSQRIFFTAADHGQEIIYRTNVPGGNLHRFGKFVGGSLACEWSSRIRIGPGHRLAAILTRATKPSEVAIANMDEMDDSGFINMPVVSKSPSAMSMYNLRANVALATPNYLTRLNDDLLSQLDLPDLEPFTFPGANNTPVQGFLLRPPNFNPAKKYPLKFLIHGGPQGAWGDAWSYRWTPELFAADGYVVVMINPRGSTGYGQKFIDGVNGDWGGKPYIDLMRGLDFTEKKYPFIDRSRECALGASYGGFMADWILTHTNRFACIVTHDGMVNPESAYGTTEELWFNEWEFRRQTPTGPDMQPAQPWRYATGPAEQDPFRKWSAIRYIWNAKTPTLVIHSQRDYRLDVSEGLQLFTALQRRSVPSEMLYFPDEGHWILKPQNSELWYKTVNDWCDRWTHSNAFANSTPPGAASAPAARSVTFTPGAQPKSQQPDR